MKDKEKTPHNKLFIILTVTAVLLMVSGIVAVVVAVNQYIGIKNKDSETAKTTVVYETVPGNAKPVEKEVPEEITNYEQPVSFPPTKLLDVPYINQNAKYPTGCESISAVMALNYAGYEITPETFIDDYLPKSDVPYVDGTGRVLGHSPSKAFIGNPYQKSGWGCYYPVIMRCLNKIIDSEVHSITALHNTPLNALKNYINSGTPVIIWATQGMSRPKKSQSWTIIDSGRTFTWVSPNHCLLLVGYDDTGYYFNDPQTHKNCRYPADIAEKRYNSMGKQALAITETSLSNQE